MKTVVAFVLTVVLAVIGAILLNETRLIRRLATDEERLVTLRYETTAPDKTTLLDRVSLPFSPAGSAPVHSATMTYWQARYEALTPMTRPTGQQQTNDPNILLIAANAAFRASPPDAANAKASVERLDSVIQAYGDVLRGDPNNIDAAYNYEYVVKVRDALAVGKPAARKDQKPEPKPIALSTDLPTGPTPHGRPGAPPTNVAMDDFKTRVPLENDERGDEAERQPVRKGRKG